jgi:hypothetical protein
MSFTKRIKAKADSARVTFGWRQIQYQIKKICSGKRKFMISLKGKYWLFEWQTVTIAASV